MNNRINILVTGSNGQLGRHIAWLASGSSDNYMFADIEELDITDKRAVDRYVADNKIDVIINCAAYTNVDQAEDNEADAMHINATAVGYLADSMKNNGGTLIHISTDYVFGGERHNTPIAEDGEPNPRGAYGRTKLAGEKQVIASGCKYLIIRTAWLYSEYGKNFVKTMMALTGSREEVRVVEDQVGSPTYAGDLASAIFEIVEERKYADNQGIYHYTNEGVCSWYDFAMEIKQMAGNERCRVTPCRSAEYPSKVERPAYSVLDKSKCKQTFKIEIPYWKESLEKCIKNIKSSDQ